MRLALLCLLAGFATVVAGKQRLSVRTVSVAEGLSQSSAQVILQDRMGIVWIGTQDGLNRYDGNDVRVFKPEPLNPFSLPGSSVTSIFEASGGGLWVGTSYGGLGRLDRKTGRFEVFRHDPADSTSISSDEVSAIVQDVSGILWIATTGGGLNRYDIDTGTFSVILSESEAESGLPSDLIFDLKAQPDGSLLVATDGGGLSLFDPESGLFTGIWPSAADTTSYPAVVDIATDPRGGIWLGTPDGLVYLDPASEEVRRVAGLEHRLVFSVLAGSDGTVWAGTAADGLHAIDPGLGSARLPEAVGLGDNAIYTLMEDASGLLWVGTESFGAKVLTPTVDRFSALGMELESPETWAILETSWGEIWAATAEGGIDIMDLDGSFLRSYRSSGGLAPIGGNIPFGVVRAMMEDSRGDVWIGMDLDGAARWDHASDAFTWFEPEGRRGLQAYSIGGLAEDSEGSIWLGTSGWGLAKYDEQGDVFEHILVVSDSLDGANSILSISITDADYLWLGTENGIVGFDTRSRETLVIRSDPEREDGLSTPTVFQVIATEDGALWAATMLGVNLLRKIPAPGETARFERLTEETGLPNDVVYSIQLDGNGVLWMSTNQGLAALDPETGDVRVFSPNEGLPGFEYNHGSFHTGPGGSLYFGGIDGITRVELDSRTFREFDAPIVVSTVEVFGETIASNLGDGAQLRLRHDENYLTFSFSALDYLRPEASRFAFRLEPDDAGWRQAGTRRYQSYNNLDPGHYTFSVRGTNGDGVWSSGATSIEIYIVPPLWRRTWFLVLMSTLGLTAMGALITGWHGRGLKERDAKIMVQRQINDRLEAERVHLARELHDGPLQHLQLSGFQLTALDGRVEDEALSSLEGVRDAVGEAMRELRSICGELRPPALVHFGLASAIRSHADRMVESYEDLSVELQLPTTARMLSPRLRLGFFRMYQEAMSNIVRHARPCTAGVSLVIGEERVELIVRDDGPGFRVPSGWSKLAAGGHFGLLGAQERAAALNGIMDVSSVSGKGTTVAFGAPTVFDEEAKT